VYGQVRASRVVNGRVLFDGVPGGTRLEFTLHVPGHPRIDREVEVTTDSLDLGDVRLERGVDLRGRVLGADRAPLEGARVLAEDGLSGAGTDDRGAFVLVGQATGDVSIAVFHEGHVASVMDVVLGLDSPPIEIVLARGALVRAAAFGADGKPLPSGTWVSVRFLGDARGIDPPGVMVAEGGTFETRLRAGGHRFEVAGVPYGEWTFAEGETRDLVLSPERR
jgi:hypothetical protein